jgi:hypothetical protein
MKNILIIFSIPFLFANTTFCQSKSETEDYLTINLTSLGISKKIPFDGGFLKRDISVRFFQNYFIIKEDYYRIENQIINRGVSHHFIKISDIKELEIIQFIDKEKELDLKKRGVYEILDPNSNNGVITINKNLELGGYYIEHLTDQEIENFISNQMIEKLPGKNKINLLFWGINDKTKINKIKIAFKHLVSLNGGKILDDLF